MTTKTPYIEVPVETDHPVDLQLVIALYTVLQHFERVSPSSKMAALEYLLQQERDQ